MGLMGVARFGEDNWLAPPCIGGEGFCAWPFDASIDMVTVLEFEPAAFVVAHGVDEKVGAGVGVLEGGLELEPEVLVKVASFEVVGRDEAGHSRDAELVEGVIKANPEEGSVQPSRALSRHVHVDVGSVEAFVEHSGEDFAVFDQGDGRSLCAYRAQYPRPPGNPLSYYRLINHYLLHHITPEPSSKRRSKEARRTLAVRVSIAIAAETAKPGMEAGVIHWRAGTNFGGDKGGVSNSISA